MELKTVIKRDGREVEFSRLKIQDAVDKACHATNEPEMGNFVFHELEDRLVDKMNVEQIQDMIEEVLMKYNPNVARAYIKYRYNREQLRSIRPIDLVDKYLDESDWRVKENASVGFSLGGMILNNSGAVTANYWLNKIYPKEIGDAHRACKFHIHDLSMLACYCVGHNFLDLIREGIGGVPGKITSKPAKHLSTLFNQLVNYNGLLQNENSGAMAYSSVDTYVAPFIKIDNLSRKEVYQCVQSLLFGLNCSSRWGCVPISTRLLTQDGWKQCSEVKIGDVVYTVNPKTRKVEFNSVKKITRKLNDKEFLIKLYNKDCNYEQIVSYEHRVYTGNGEIHRAYEFLDEEANFTVPLSVDEGFGLTSKFESIERINIPVEVEKIPYDGEVWCPTTDNGVVFFQDINGHEFISANSQAPFSNFTLDWIVPNDLAETYCWVGGKQVDFKYKDCQKEMDMFNEVLLDLFEKGDADGRLYSYPICTYSITKDFDWESSNAKKLFEITCKYGMPYFQNFINSDLSPSDIRSMCIMPDTVIRILNPDGKWEEDSIKNIFDNYDENEIKVLTRWGYYPIKRKIVIKYSGKMYKFTTQSGKILITTPDHPHLIYAERNKNDKSLIIRQAKDLKVGDKFSVRYEKNTIQLWNNKNRGKTCEERFGEEKGKLYRQKCSDRNKRLGRWQGNSNPMRTMTDEQNRERMKKISQTSMGHPVSEKCRKASSERWKANNPIHSQGYWDHVQETNGHTTIASDWEFKFRKELDALGLEYKHQFVINDSNGNFTGIADFYIPSKNLVIELETNFSGDTHCYYNDEIEDSPYVKKPWNQVIRNAGYNLLVFDPSNNDDSYRGYINYRDEIVSIELIDYDGLVYDLEVDSPDDYNQSESLGHTFYANNILTHNCCRLRLDKRELMKRGGGLFGAAEKTGSTGVVTINLPQLGYRFKGDKEGFYKELDCLLVMAKESLVIKRKTIEELLEGQFYPYSKVYVQSYDTFFNTIGINGCNECIRNFTNDEHDITDEWGQAFTNELMDYINSRLSDFQEETGLLFNLEATPAEGTGYRFALHDKKNYPDIITANDNGDPYYTNSTWLPATFTDDIFEALDIQDQFQVKYTGGTVFHAYLGERIHNWKACAELIKTIFTNYRLPYLTISPTFSICPKHGYLDGEQKFCPKCRDEELARVDAQIREVKEAIQKREMEETNKCE